jgi:hypothetical protein
MRTAKMIQKKTGPSPSPSPPSPGVELNTDQLQNAIASASPITATHRNLQGTANATTPPRLKGMKPVSKAQVNAFMAVAYL